MDQEEALSYSRLISHEVRKITASASRCPLLASIEDLESVGRIALIQAAGTFRPELGEFKMYARYRIRHTLQDYLRNIDNLTRDHRKAIKQGQAQQVVHFYLDQQIDGDSSGHEIISNILPSSDEYLTREDDLDREKRLKAIQEAISALNPRLQYVIQQIYFKDSTQIEVARELGVCESRVSQMHHSALKKIKAQLQLNSELKRKAQSA